MSLPTCAAFYRNGIIVGVGFCNVGWFIRPEGIKRCIKQAMDDAWDRYRPEVVVDERFAEVHRRYDKYFTTEEDLKNFDEISLYEFIIPRELALRVYFDKISDEEWNGEFITLKRVVNEAI